MKPSRVEYVNAHGISLAVRHWGDNADPKVFMLHGWMDISASFQFVVDALKGKYHVIAPDIRGFGYSQWASGGYWFPEYLVDLEAILDYYAPNESVVLVGHSLGGYITSVYAGVRPHRVSKLVSLEGYGIIENRPKMAPDRLTRWLDDQKQVPTLRPYPSLEAVANRLQENNARLTRQRALFLSNEWAQKKDNGLYELMADPKHKRLPVLSRLDEVLACWSKITAKALFIEGEFSLLGIRMKDQVAAQEEIKRRASHIKNIEIKHVKNAGHMLQHDQPEAVAALIEEFLNDQY